METSWGAVGSEGAGRDVRRVHVGVFHTVDPEPAALHVDDHELVGLIILTGGQPLAAAAHHPGDEAPDAAKDAVVVDVHVTAKVDGLVFGEQAHQLVVIEPLPVVVAAAIHFGAKKRRVGEDKQRALSALFRRLQIFAEPRHLVPAVGEAAGARGEQRDEVGASVIKRVVAGIPVRAGDFETQVFVAGPALPIELSSPVDVVVAGGGKKEDPGFGQRREHFLAEARPHLGHLLRGSGGRDLFDADHVTCVDHQLGADLMEHRLDHLCRRGVYPSWSIFHVGVRPHHEPEDPAGGKGGG